MLPRDLFRTTHYHVKDSVKDLVVSNWLGTACADNAIAQVVYVRRQYELEITAATRADNNFVLGDAAALFLYGGLEASAVLGEVDNCCTASSINGGMLLRVHVQIRAFSN